MKSSRIICTRYGKKQKIFQALGLAEVEIENKFGFFLRALEYGAPPHGGIALGLDRVVAMILGVSSIRDVIAFSKNRSAVCPLTDAPSSVDKKQLDELHLKTGKFYRTDTGEIEKKEIEGEISDKVGEDIISEAEVRHIAQLARLSLNEEEIALFRKDLNSILHYVEVLNEIDTQNISPTSHILLEKNIWREDNPKKSNKSEEIFINAPQKQNTYFKVPKILEEM